MIAVIIFWYDHRKEDGNVGYRVLHDWHIKREVDYWNAQRSRGIYPNGKFRIFPVHKDFVMSNITRQLIWSTRYHEVARIKRILKGEE